MAGECSRSVRGRIARCAVALLALCAGSSASLGVSTTIADGALQRTDREGTVHAAGGIAYQLWEYDDFSPDDLITSAYTGTGAGSFGMVTNEEDGALDNYLEVYANVYARGLSAAAYGLGGVPISATLPSPSTYWSTPIGAGTGAIPVAHWGTYTFDNDTDFGRMLGAIQATNFMAAYYTSKNKYAPLVQIDYQSSNTQSSEANGTLTLRYAAWDDWDEIVHEFGHNVAESNDFDYRDPITGSPTWAGEHSAGFDNISGATQGGFSYGQVKGARLAWGEGVATSLGMFAIADGHLATAIPNLPVKDVDHEYRSTAAGGLGQTRVPDSTVGLAYSMETSMNNSTREIGGTVHSAAYRGEGDEWSVASVLWDLYDDTPGEVYTSAGRANRSDRVHTSVDVILSDMGGADDFQDFWQHLTITADTEMFKTDALGLPANASANQARAILGEVLEEHAISAMPLTAGNFGDANPTLNFVKGNNGNSHLFKVLVFDAAWNLFDQSAEIPEGDPKMFTLTNALTIHTNYWWVVLSNSALDGFMSPGAGFDKWYWSGANKIRYIPAPGPAMLMVAGGLVAATRRRRAA